MTNTNIENRLAKLEANLKTSSPKVCECHNIYFRKMLDKVYEGVPFDYENFPLPEGDFCAKCKKPADKDKRDYFKQISEIYGDVYSYVYYAKHLEMTETHKRVSEQIKDGQSK